MNERDVLTLWRNLFKEQGITKAVLTKANKLLESLSSESPLRHRLKTELEEIRNLPPKK
jgi:hypothetical protein